MLDIVIGIAILHAMAHPLTDGAVALREYLATPDAPSQHALAVKLGIQQPSVSGWVRGTSRPEPHLRAALEIVAGIPAASWDTDAERAVVERVQRAAV